MPPQHGQHLVLTIDANLQMIAEQELRDAVEHVNAPRGEFVAMDPYTRVMCWRWRIIRRSIRKR